MPAAIALATAGGSRAAWPSWRISAGNLDSHTLVAVGADLHADGAARPGFARVRIGVFERFRGARPRVGLVVAWRKFRKSELGARARQACQPGVEWAPRGGP